MRDARETDPREDALVESLALLLVAAFNREKRQRGAERADLIDEEGTDRGRGHVAGQR